MKELNNYLEKQINFYCEGWEEWYPKYHSCDAVAFVSDVFVWLERKLVPKSESINDPEAYREDSFAQRVCDEYNGNITLALWHVLKVVMGIYNTYQPKTEQFFRLGHGNGYLIGSFDSLEKAEEHWEEIYKNRNKGDGYDDYWRNTEITIQRVQTNITNVKKIN